MDLSKTVIAGFVASAALPAGRRLDARKLSGGYTIRAKVIGPDGSTIAFTAYYDGNLDIYTIPSTGGIPRRLTYHSFPDIVVDWHPDGKKILFRSYRESKTNPGPRYMRLYTIGTGGGYPEALPLFEGELASYSPDGGKIAYNRLSREFRTWKRYRGGMAQDIWLYDFTENTSEKLTDFAGTDAVPMWSFRCTA